MKKHCRAFALILLASLAISTGCRDDEPQPKTVVNSTPEDFTEEEKWAPVGDRSVAELSDDSTRSGTFKDGEFDPTPHVPTFELQDTNTLTITAENTPLTLGAEQSKMARVNGDFLEFPMAMADEAMAWEPGEIIVSGGGGPRNPFGFARRVISTEQVGDTVVVETIKADLSEFMQGDLVLTFDPDEFEPLDLSTLDPDWVRENLGEDSLPGSPSSLGWSTSVPTYNVVAGAGFFLGDFFDDVGDAFEEVGDAIEDGINELVNALSVTLNTGAWHGFDTGTLSVTFPIPKTQLSAIKPARGGNLQTYIEGFVKPSFALNFDPGLQLEMTISPDPDDARIKLNMDSKIKVDAGIHTNIEVGIESWDGVSGPDLKRKLSKASLGTETALLAFSQAVSGDPRFTPGAEWKKTIWTSQPFVKGFVVGVVPVAVVARFHLEAGCSFVAKGTVDFRADSSVELKTKFSAEQYYLKLGEAPRFSGPTLSTSASGSWSVVTGANAQLECFMLPSVEVSLYDALGVVMGPRISPFVAQIEAQSTCPNTYHPQSFSPQTDASLKLFTAISGQASIKISPPGVPEPALTIGPQIFGQWTKDIVPPQDMSFELGIGYCTPQCEDGIQNGNETAVDCGGGGCGPCAEGRTCQINTDCAQNVCLSSSGVCNSNTCENGVRDGQESDVDCGTPECGACALGAQCLGDGNCQSLICSISGTCIDDNCQDGKQDADECAVDCGGACDAKCAANTTCTVAEDCASGYASRFRCLNSHCEDGRQSGDETGPDCGGSLCGPCRNRQRCNDDSDCQSGICSVSGRCAATECFDGIKNNDEADVDCSGSCTLKCGPNRLCNSDADCTLNICSASGTCAFRQCDDGFKNGSESDIDCGGSCDACELGKQCVENSDCVNDICSDSGRCVSTQCEDGLQNGNETDVDCGGDRCAPCALAKGCNRGADCESRWCSRDLSPDTSNDIMCLEPSCSDGTRNGFETGTDCGGPCQGCATGAACTQGSDCQSGFCSVTTNQCVANSCEDGVLSGVESDVDCGADFACDKCAQGKTCGFDFHCESQNCACGEDSGDCFDSTTGTLTGTCGVAKETFTQLAGNTTSAQLFTVPAGCNQIYVRAWGGGGGSTPAPGGAQTGGAGGYVHGSASVTPGDGILVKVAHGGYPAGNMSTPWGHRVGGQGDTTGTSGGGSTLVAIGAIDFAAPGGGGSSMNTAGTAADESLLTSTHSSNDGADAAPGSDQGGGGAGTPGGLPGMPGSYGPLPAGFTSEADPQVGWMPGGTTTADYSQSCQFGMVNDVPAGASDSIGSGTSAGYGGQGCVVIRCQ